MRAQAVWFAAPRVAELRSVEVGAPESDEILVEAIASGISHGTEMLIYRGEGPTGQRLTPETCEGESMGSFPIKYGYQSVGRVAEAGRASGYSPGDLVFVRFPHQDRYVVRVSPDLVYRLPPYDDPIIGIFGNLLDVAVNALLDAPVRIGDVVVVSGLGVVGLFITQLVRRTAGTVVVIDPVAKRRDLALRFGADVAAEPHDAPSLVDSVSEGRGADIVFEASGATKALQTAIDVTGLEGTVVVVSWYGDRVVDLRLSPEFHIGRERLVSSQVNYLGSGLQPRWDVARRMRVVLELLPRLHPTDLISHRLSVTDAPDAYRLIDERPDEVIAVALTYPRS